jgi:hypothetical protein
MATITGEKRTMGPPHAATAGGMNSDALNRSARSAASTPGQLHGEDAPAVAACGGPIVRFSPVMVAIAPTSGVATSWRQPHQSDADTTSSPAGGVAATGDAGVASAGAAASPLCFFAAPVPALLPKAVGATTAPLAPPPLRVAEPAALVAACCCRRRRSGGLKPQMPKAAEAAGVAASADRSSGHQLGGASRSSATPPPSTPSVHSRQAMSRASRHASHRRDGRRRCTSGARRNTAGLAPVASSVAVADSAGSCWERACRGRACYGRGGGHRPAKPRCHGTGAQQDARTLRTHRSDRVQHGEALLHRRHVGSSRRGDGFAADLASVALAARLALPHATVCSLLSG